VLSAPRVAAATLIAAAVTGSTGAGAAPRADTPILAFSFGSMGLCATDLQGHTFRLTGPNQSGGALTWAPDGSQLVYKSGQARISFVDADGHGQRSLGWSSGDGEHYSTDVSGLAWSPDSHSLAFVLTTGYHYGGYRSQLWVSQNVARTLSYGTIIGRPSWSPDGRQIVYADWATSKAHVVDVGSGSEREVIDGADQPVWSPDGQLLAYVAFDSYRRSVGLAVARPDGSDQRLLVKGNVVSPAWSPDGHAIAFTRLGTSSEIHVTERDGTGDRVVGGAAVSYPGPEWSPAGDAIAYAGEPGIVVVSPDGTTERVVESGVPGVFLSYPAWRRSAPLPTRRRACVITGTPGADVLRGRNKGDVLYGGDGNDRIHGAGGNDVLIGGPGHDWLYGGPGTDVFHAKDDTRDYLFGGPGTDRGAYDLGGRDKTKSVEHYEGE
jgi:hypothetical protein